METTTRGSARPLALIGALLAWASLGGCERGKKAEQPRAAPAGPVAPAAIDLDEEPVQPLPDALDDVDMRKVALGRRLYHDARLSGDGTVSCATCHSMDRGGAEHRRTSLGIQGQVGPINSPTVLNSRFNFVQFWNGRAKDLVEQAAGPVENPVEMGGSFDEVCATLAEDEAYRADFAAIYGNRGITKETITNAIAEYERSLITPSPFDAFLRGDQDAITAEAKEGYALFKASGCPACHYGVGIGGARFEKLGKLADYFGDRGEAVTEADLGRYTVTGDDADRHVFKVPTLRNVALTAPYLHDGSQETLESTVKLMARYQLARELTDAEVDKIVAFLESLTGELPPHARLQEGELPPEVLAPEPPAPATAAPPEG